MNLLLKFFSEFQNFVSKNVVIEYLDFEKVKRIGFLDCGYRKDKIKCVCLIFNKEKNIIEKSDEIIGNTFFPYIPGFLFLREAPYMFELIDRNPADLYVIDGHGLAHPRRAGIATVIGVIKNVPTIGIAKSFLFGKIENNKIFLDNMQVGIKFERYYLSIGNKVDLKTIESFLSFFNYKYPWPMKEVDRISKLL